MFNIFASSLIALLCASLAESKQEGYRHVRRLHAELDENNALRIVHDALNPTALAWASFEDSMLREGWGYLHVETNPKYPDDLTAYAAGALEADATMSVIKNHEQNRYTDFCSNFTHVTCDRVIEYVQEQVDYLYEMAQHQRLQSEFWNQVYLILQQLTGLSDRYTGGTLNHGNRFKPSENSTTMIVNWEADLFDIEEVLPIIDPKKKKPRSYGLRKRRSHTPSRIRGLYVKNRHPGRNGDRYFSYPPGHCSALIKYINNNIIIGHNSWFDYSSMLRIEKKYNFRFRMRGDNSSLGVPGSSMVMTSYPGIIWSLDEFYLIQSGLFVMETSLSIFDKAAMRRCKAKSVPTWIRSMVANRLASSGKSWASHFSQENSGTYNNQYMIVDFGKFEDGGRTITDDVFWLLEQMPGIFVSRDMSNVLKHTGYFPSFNIPIFKETRRVSGAEEYEEFTNFYKYETNPRKLIFDRDQGSVDSISTMMRIMRSNNYKHDNLSICHECKPPTRVATFAIAARADLVEMEKHPVYIFEGLIGATDAKVIDFHSFKRQKIALLNGPPHEHVPMFSWSSHDLPSPAGHPDKYDFLPVTHEFEVSLQQAPSKMGQTRWVAQTRKRGR